jgi:D-glycero-alpha-D-manno-heptose-7-phosphate kinase
VIIARSPLRITLGGGGTDLPSYYTEFGGFAIAAAIDKYVYVTVMRPFTPGIYLKYSSLEHVERLAEVRHPIIREALAFGLERQEAPQIEITTLADIPAGTGLGSSASFTTALLKALLTHQRKVAHARELAEIACDIEINKLREPVGKQDQYACAFGGITCLTFHRDHRVEVEPLSLSSETIFALEDNLLLFYTGVRRAASSVLRDQDTRSLAHDVEVRRNLDFVKELGYRSRAALEAGELHRFGELMHEHWQHKRRRSTGVSNLQIDDWYSRAMNNGAVGGKLVGAGGGGFLMFYASDPNRLRHAMAQAGLPEVRFRFDFEGTKVVLS